MERYSSIMRAPMTRLFNRCLLWTNQDNFRRTIPALMRVVAVSLLVSFVIVAALQGVLIALAVPSLKELMVTTLASAPISDFSESTNRELATVDGRIIPVSRQTIRFVPLMHTLEPASKSPINPHPFKFILLEEDICLRKKKDVFVLAVVHTAPKNYKRRMLIRETWGSQTLYAQMKTVTIFAMGATNDSKIQQSVLLESEHYHDIIQEDFLDSYKNLTYKGIMWLKWTSYYCPKAAFVLKVDDDIFVNIFNLVNHVQNLLKHNQLASRTILCLVWGRMPVMRDPKNKWYITKEEYEPDHFSKYCSGSAYIISQSLIYPMYIKSFETKFIWVDDFYISGLLPQNLTDEYVNLGSLYVFKPGELNDRLVSGFAIFGHVPGSLTKRYKLWKEILEIRGINQ